MDVGNPSNLERVRYLYNDQIEIIKDNIHVFSFDDNKTRQAIREIFSEFNYVMDPHGSVGYLAAKQDNAGNDNNNHYIILETAHPAKFSDKTDSFIREKIIIPDQLKESLNKKKHAIRVSKDYTEFKDSLLITLKK